MCGWPGIFVGGGEGVVLFAGFVPIDEYEDEDNAKERGERVCVQPPAGILQRSKWRTPSMQCCAGQHEFH